MHLNIVRTLGEGTYGKVKLASDSATGSLFAVKIIRKNAFTTNSDAVRVKREIAIMTSVCHRNISKVFDVYESTSKITLIMEYVCGGELYDYVYTRSGLCDDEAKPFFQQIVSAVAYLHKNGIVHRDLKLENILLDDSLNIKITDFGLANEYKAGNYLKTFCGSPLYASPEIINGVPYLGPEVDCWSLGVILYAMVYGSMPFDGSDCRKLRKQISTGTYFEPPRYSDAHSLIHHLLTPEPPNRATVNQAQVHWWMRSRDENSPVDLAELSEPVDRGRLQLQLSTNCFGASNICEDGSEQPNASSDLLKLLNSSSELSSGPYDDHSNEREEEFETLWNEGNSSGTGLADNDEDDEETARVVLRKKHNVSPHDGFDDGCPSDGGTRSRHLSERSDSGNVLYDFDDIEAVLNSLEAHSAAEAAEEASYANYHLSPSVDRDDDDDDAAKESSPSHAGSTSMCSSDVEFSDSDYMSRSDKTIEASSALSYRSELHMTRFSTPKQRRGIVGAGRSLDSTGETSDLCLGNEAFLDDEDDVDDYHDSSPTSVNRAIRFRAVTCVSRLDGLQLTSRSTVASRFRCRSVGSEPLLSAVGASADTREAGMAVLKASDVSQLREKRKRQRRVFDDDEDSVLRAASDIAKKLC